MQEEANDATAVPLKAEEPALQPADHSVVQPAEQTADQTADQPAEQSAVPPSHDGADVEAATLTLKVMRSET